MVARVFCPISRNQSWYELIPRDPYLEYFRPSMVFATTNEAEFMQVTVVWVLSHLIGAMHLSEYRLRGAVLITRSCAGPRSKHDTDLAG